MGFYQSYLSALLYPLLEEDVCRHAGDRPPARPGVRLGGEELLPGTENLANHSSCEKGADEQAGMSTHHHVLPPCSKFKVLRK